uniref:Uncharacterized protein n=1 Tax=Varanus komodoensis TaxID=61221 RepID=A0A8D2KV98_VARKO
MANWYRMAIGLNKGQKVTKTVSKLCQCQHHGCPTKHISFDRHKDKHVLKFIKKGVGLPSRSNVPWKFYNCSQLKLFVFKAQLI